jgi:hypothetical protein
VSCLLLPESAWLLFPSSGKHIDGYGSGGCPAAPFDSLDSSVSSNWSCPWNLGDVWLPATDCHATEQLAIACGGENAGAFHVDCSVAG